MAHVDQIHLGGVRTHNLKGADVDIPIGSYTVVTGVSGSGKSSLVFDSLYGESYRRYVESLSSYARQYLKMLEKADIDTVENLPAAIAVEQSKQTQSQRSTVGTMSELFDVLRILFTHLSDIYCCGEIIRKENGESLAQRFFQLHEKGRLMVLAPLAEWKHLNAKDLKAHLEAQGFTRAFVGGEIERIEKTSAKALREGFVIVDRVSIEDENYRRFADSVDLALRLGRGKVSIYDPNEKIQEFTSSLECRHCSKAYFAPSLSLFNFNHPLGACEACQGFGRVAELDPDKIVPDRRLSLADKGVACWNFGAHVEMYRYASKSAKLQGISLKKAFEDYNDQDWHWLYFGDDSGFDGIHGYFRWLDSKKYKAHYRIHAARYRSYVRCPSCDGSRLKPQALACLIGEHNLAELCDWTLARLYTWFEELARMHQSEHRKAKVSMGAEEAIHEGLTRLRYLIKVGLPYLSLNRSSRSLSGGEQQRMNMARSLGNTLTATLFCLDEPSSGLHPRDSHRLLEVICELRDQGNTVVVVEHERALIDGADHLIEIGPKAGHEGGHVIFQGSPKDFSDHRVDFKWSSWKPTRSFIKLKNATTLNLKSVDFEFPKNALSVVCGVSGSGKTSLVQHTFYPMMAKILGKDIGDLELEPKAASLSPKKSIEGFVDCILVSQEGIGRSTRSNIATYLGIFDEVRKLFAMTPAAKSRKLKPGYFSFNVAGGRCETCKGLGSVEEDLSFLGEMNVICPDCEGRRFQKQALEVTYKEKSVLDILNMTIGQAREFFHGHPNVVKILDTVVSMGLGYLSLGQHTSSFSGGEAQRLKLAKFLLEKHNDGPRLFIFDEPTTGLSDRDVEHFLEQLRFLCSSSHTVLVVEHHLGVIKAADWLVELGPEAAQDGGEIVFSGQPRDLLEKDTYTAKYLKLFEESKA